ncbi:MAG: dual specificity protein phosphatase family protein [Candidatus Lokiarchaeota archaeon]|nr:dual specificity protein phosphatase family protein [Candidatus Lokiarchaeota archaeon]
MVRPWYWPKNGMPERTEDFTWIVKDKIAASWWPDPPVFKIYKEEGIRVIINSSEFDNRTLVPKEFIYYHINIPDYGIPTNSQIKRFLEITNIHNKRKEPIVVHCVAGCGRTGQLIIIWAAKNGYIPQGMDPIKWIRIKRACCLETKEQMEFARKMVKKYNNR